MIIKQYEPKFDITDLNTSFTSYFQSGGWITEYIKTQEFENKIKKFLGVKYCFVVNNGTISLSLALLAGGIKPGDEVLVPNLSMIATANAITLIGAIPIFIDIEPETLCLDLIKARQKITKNTKAIIYVTLNGRSISPQFIRTFCVMNNLLYISDDAQSFGSSYSNNSKIGTFGDICSFSFSMPKIITTGQGGCLVTNNDKLADKIKKLKDFGRTSESLDIYEEFGINSKFTDLQALVGLSQLKTINWRIKRKKEIYKSYYENLKNIKNIFFTPTDLNYVTPWFVDIFVKNPLDRDKLIKYLEKYNIKTRLIYPPINKQLCYVNHFQHFEIFENTIFYSERGFWLPSSFTLTNKDILYICDKIKKFYNSYA